VLGAVFLLYFIAKRLFSHNVEAHVAVPKKLFRVTGKPIPLPQKTQYLRQKALISAP